MSYIRIADQVIDLDKTNYFIVTKEDINTYGLKKGDQFILLNNFPVKITGCKHTKTIEELCDEFVYVASENDRPVICYKPTVFHKLNDNLYGAIWTDKGLIYVAKMNDKGELELL